MKLTLIAAIADDGIIGIPGGMPWDIPRDLLRFKQLTIDHPVIVGKTTFEELRGKGISLIRRPKIVVSNSMVEGKNVYWANGKEQALEYAQQLLPEDKKVFVIGGARAYDSFFDDCNFAELTMVHGEYYSTHEGCVYFPRKFDEWDVISQESVAASKNIPAHTYMSLSRVK